MRLSDFDYELPKERIAQTPLKDRDQSRLMALDRGARSLTHHRFFELPGLLDQNSVLVMNQSRVIPARLRFKAGNGLGEWLLVRPASDGVWECIGRPGDKLQPGFQAEIGAGLSFEVLEVMDSGLRRVRFESPDFEKALERHGEMPTPPYIKEKLNDKERYQTVYAKDPGSVAAPTAGLHFTPAVFEALKARGIETEFLTLHVGLGTFQPVKTEQIEAHRLHSEWFELTAETAARLNEAKRAGKKIVAVGTTSIRTLESCADENGVLQPRAGETSLFITPGYRFKFVDQIITNFHVPKSSLLMLVSAFAGREFILQAYETAKREAYRFFSFGDAMWIR